MRKRQEETATPKRKRINELPEVPRLRHLSPANQLMHEQLDVWKNYANPKERKKEMEKTYELQMQSMIHNHS